MIDAAVVEIPALHKKLGDAIRTHDAKTTRRLAHTIKGVASAISALKIHSTAAVIERSAAMSDLDSAARQFEHLGEMIDEVIGHCREFAETP